MREALFTVLILAGFGLAVALGEVCAHVLARWPW